MKGRECRCKKFMNEVFRGGERLGEHVMMLRKGFCSNVIFGGRNAQVGTKLKDIQELFMKRLRPLFCLCEVHVRTIHKGVFA